MEPLLCFLVVLTYFGQEHGGNGLLRDQKLLQDVLPFCKEGNSPWKLRSTVEYAKFYFSGIIVYVRRFFGLTLFLHVEEDLIVTAFENVLLFVLFVAGEFEGQDRGTLKGVLTSVVVCIATPLPEAYDTEYLVLHACVLRVICHFYTTFLQFILVIFRFIVFLFIVLVGFLVLDILLDSAVNLVFGGKFLSGAVGLHQDEAVVNLRVGHALQVISWHVEGHILPRFLQVCFNFANVLSKLGQISRIFYKIELFYFAVSFTCILIVQVEVFVVGHFIIKVLVRWVFLFIY